MLDFEVLAVIVLKFVVVVGRRPHGALHLAGVEKRASADASRSDAAMVAATAHHAPDRRPNYDFRFELTRSLRAS